MQITLPQALTLARRIAPVSHSAAARVLMAAKVPFLLSCRYAIHLARVNRKMKKG